MILDIHTHHPAPQPEGVISCAPDDFNPLAGQLYSLGLHPWNLKIDNSEALEKLAKLAEQPCVVAIGETGIDMVHPGAQPLWVQMNVMKAHIELSERLHKPLVVHDVKAHDVIVGLRKELAVTMPWIIHGFRGNPTVAQMLLDAGCYLSFGEKFNPDSLCLCPLDRLLAETDESPLSITSIIAQLAAALTTQSDLSDRSDRSDRTCASALTAQIATTTAAIIPL